MSAVPVNVSGWGYVPTGESRKQRPPLPPYRPSQEWVTRGEAMEILGIRRNSVRTALEPLKRSRQVASPGGRVLMLWRRDDVERVALLVREADVTPLQAARLVTAERAGRIPAFVR